LGKQNSSFGSSLLEELSDVPVLTIAIKPALLVAGKLLKVQVHEHHCQKFEMMLFLFSV
jgi:hypothetical protein